MAWTKLTNQNLALAKIVELVVASQSDPFGKSLYLLGITRSPT